MPSWLALASTGFDVLLLGVAVALWDAFDEGQALRADMLRSFIGSVVVAVLFGGQALVGMAVTDEHAALSVLLFTSLAVAIGINVLADPLAGVLDRLAFSSLACACAPTAPRCAAPKPRCRCGRRARWTASTTRRSSG